MQKRILYLLIASLAFTFCKYPRYNISKTTSKAQEVQKIEMNLSAFGVESDNFPSIEGFIDFEHDSNSCTTSYYNPAIKGRVYSLSNQETKKVLELLQNCDLDKLKAVYKAESTDQPTSTITIYKSNRVFIVKDYGLIGDFPLQDIYKLVYKF